MARFFLADLFPKKFSTQPQENMASSPRVNPKNMVPIVVLVDFLRLVRLSVLDSLSNIEMADSQFFVLQNEKYYANVICANGRIYSSGKTKTNQWKVLNI